MKGPFAAGLLVAIGLPVAFALVFLLTGGVQSVYMEPICDGVGNLACDQGIWRSGLSVSPWALGIVPALAPAAVLVALHRARQRRSGGAVDRVSRSVHG